MRFIEKFGWEAAIEAAATMASATASAVFSREGMRTDASTTAEYGSAAAGIFLGALNAIGKAEVTD